MKEIKLKAFYVICIVSFLVINAHAAAFFLKILLPLSRSTYTISANLAGDVFLGMVVYTIIAGIANIFFLKKLQKQSMNLFFILMIMDTLCLGLAILFSIILHNVNGRPVATASGLLYGAPLIGIFVAKEALLFMWFNKKSARA